MWSLSVITAPPEPLVRGAVGRPRRDARSCRRSREDRDPPDLHTAIPCLRRPYLSARLPLWKRAARDDHARHDHARAQAAILATRFEVDSSTGGFTELTLDPAEGHGKTRVGGDRDG